MIFTLKSSYKPAGDQPQAIRSLVNGLEGGFGKQTLLGITGSGKTYTVANVIEKVQKPTLVISHNKTLTAQLCNEFRHFFPNNAVHYFVSYYDYYQPEAYIPHSNTYIRKEALINDEIDRLRHGATTDLLTRKDVIVVASVSCIYDLGLPEIYRKNILRIRRGEKTDRKTLIEKLVKMNLVRTPSVLERGRFRVQGDVIQVAPVNEDVFYYIEIEEDVVSKIFTIDPLEGFSYDNMRQEEEIFLSPPKHFMQDEEGLKKALKKIEKELEERILHFEKQKMPLEAERIEQITRNDIARLRETGFCHGVENYSRHLSGRGEGETPSSLLDYFGDDFLTVIDESHITVPQIGAMYHGNKSRKESLIKHGFRLPSAIDNRPLTYQEFDGKSQQMILVSATPSDYEKQNSKQVVEQIIRPTGLVDPKLTVSSCKTQIKDLLERIDERVKRNHRVLVTTLTKKMAEELTDYLRERGIKVAYIHSDVSSLDRVRILTKLRRGEVEVLVGVNLLREGLDLPEVSLVAILDADKEGFLRSETALIQTIGRAARNVEGEVLLYADKITGSMKRAIEETERRREMQIAYNKKHNIVPQTIVKEITDIVPVEDVLELEMKPLIKSKKEIERFLKSKERDMKVAAKELNFELAAVIRDEIKKIKEKIK